MKPRDENSWCARDIEDTRLETEYGKPVKRLPPGKPTKCLSARPKSKRPTIRRSE